MHVTLIWKQLKSVSANEFETMVSSGFNSELCSEDSLPRPANDTSTLTLAASVALTDAGKRPRVQYCSRTTRLAMESLKALTVTRWPDGADSKSVNPVDTMSVVMGWRSALPENAHQNIKR